MPKLTIGRQELHYLQRGGGEPLLLIMGMSGTHLAWGDPFLDELAADFSVIAYDHRGVGRSSRVEEPFTLAELADDAAALLDGLEIESAHVLGVSMGGMIAQELALRRPEMVRTLVIGCSYAGGEGSALTPPETFRRLADAWPSGDRDRALRAAWDINVSERYAGRPGAFEAWREMASTLPVALPVIGLQLQAIAPHDTSERLERIAAPTLVVHGTEDQMLPPANAKVIASRIPGARLQWMEGIGHLFWWEEPQRTADLVREHARAAAAAG